MQAPSFTVASHQVHPVDLVTAIVGSERVRLGGFEAEPMPQSFVRPGLIFVGADETPAMAVRAIRQRQRLQLVMRLGMVLLAVISAFALALWVAPAQPGAVSLRQALSDSQVLAPHWAVKDLAANGLWIEQDSGAGRPQRRWVAVGSPLPNGDVLLVVVPDKRAYSTSTGTTVIATPSTIPLAQSAQ